jgi:hypothetical protein
MPAGMNRPLMWEPEVSKYRCSLLVVDDEPYILSTLQGLLSPEF